MTDRTTINSNSLWIGTKTSDNGSTCNHKILVFTIINIISYGHDIEASWLIHEAALVLGDEKILAKVKPIIQKVAIAATEGLTENGGMI